MEAKELRIGNIVHEGSIEGYGLSDDDIIIIDAINNEYGTAQYLIDEQDSVNQSTSLDYLEGIPLTKEWLHKFGFEVSMGYYIHDDSMILLDDRFRLTNSNDCILSTGLKYVHELQNLYFALTGEEIELK